MLIPPEDSCELLQISPLKNYIKFFDSPEDESVLLTQVMNDEAQFELTKELLSFFGLLNPQGKHKKTDFCSNLYKYVVCSNVKILHCF